MKKQKIFFGNKVEYNKITVNENKDGVFSEETIRLDVIKEKKDDVLFDIEDKSKEITNDKTIIVRTLENEGEKYKNETLENLEKKFKEEEYDENQNEKNNKLNKEEDLEKHIEEKEGNKNEINTVPITLYCTPEFLNILSFFTCFTVELPIYFFFVFKSFFPFFRYFCSKCFLIHFIKFNFIFFF